jgi:hypothetical protein
MTNRIALVLGLFIAAFFVIDFALGLGGSLFLGQKFVAFVEFLAFWR